ncbi:Cutinase-like protein [Hapsidospora chrysogenum ATCC 11550]|uniref:cutinase n=1 Tax=Hapsidospora chrysogenum (strain ATCC 11550 / CBS 779.69 / DSM 880 / IAM 14645 / JCM 23072 / IMI 49137) TaxID=857340 RepID=A0A086T249_HAPC1|nr:Cutinase-like protein [Hapsidospora chrysogenum ATCC 11550]
MKPFSIILGLSAVLASALPVENETRDVTEVSGVQLETRQSTTRNDLENGSSSRCPDAILIYARGSTEAGNMGVTAGPVLASNMEREFRNIWIQGVGGPYTADLSPNFLPKGTNSQSIGEAKRLINMAYEKCPSTPVVVAGYSQGTAVVGNALTELSGPAKDNVVGAALFGYTKNLQNRGKIPNYPESRTQVYCSLTDAVCTGTLFILPGHFLYLDDAAGPAPRFLTRQINSA